MRRACIARFSAGERRRVRSDDAMHGSALEVAERLGAARRRPPQKATKKRVSCGPRAMASNAHARGAKPRAERLLVGSRAAPTGGLINAFRVERRNAPASASSDEKRATRVTSSSIGADVFFVGAHSVPPTVSPSIFSVGCPTPTGTLWPSLPHVPTPVSRRMSLPIIVTRVSASGPLPMSVAPLTG